MNCPACAAPNAAISRTVDDPSVVIRQRYCPSCEARWVTTETVMAAAMSVQKPPTLVTGSLQADSGVRLGVGGGMPSGLFSLSLTPDPSKQSERPISGSRKRRGRRDVAEYPADFLALWALAKAQGKAGNKKPAFESWQRLNADAELNALISTRFEEWMKTDSWRRGYNQHFVTWLNQRGWEESPTDADLRGADTTNARPGANGSVPAQVPRGSDYCDWHKTWRNDNKPSFRPKDGCPECKHVKAMNGTRVSDVYQEDPMVTDIKRRRGIL